MKRVKLGWTNEDVSEMCLGTMMFGHRCDESETKRLLSYALGVGVNFLDTAAMYCEGRTEEIVGRSIYGKRKEFFITTKVHKGLDEKSIAGSIEESLKRLGTDYVDLYLIHWPREKMNPEEIMESLNKVVHSGKARFVGCSNYPAWLLAYSNACAPGNGRAKFVCNQVPYNLIERGVEVEVLPQAIAEGIAITAYRPLVRGLLAGKYKAGEPPREGSRGDSREMAIWLGKYGESIQKLLKFTEGKGVSMAQVAISWLRKSPAVTCPIVGVSSLEQFKASLKAFYFDLSNEEYKEVTKMFDTEVKEEAGGAYKDLRRHLSLLARTDFLPSHQGENNGQFKLLPKAA